MESLNYVNFRRFCLFSLDAIGLSMFSMNVDSEKDKGFYRACKKLIGDGSEVSPLRVWTRKMLNENAI